MKMIGLLGGMSWESTAIYYQIINTVIKEELGDLHSAKVLLYSVDFQEIQEYQKCGEWEKSARVLANAALNLQKAGADFIVICSNTMHKVLPQISQNICIPILHIAEVTAKELQKKNILKVGLLGTKYTLQQGFYKDKLIANGIEVIIPDEDDIEIINHIIYDELCVGVVSENSKSQYLHIIKKLSGKGAEGIILGCTEIGLLISQKDTELPIFDTTYIHANQAAMYSIKD
ncbi:aspartate racemase [Helicobacter sp. 13S00482-2]|uniref:aspartate/glutamate racemase family protein n=1 Tax=Helicobacter sp. 13S00482-2 TaxID=1476200 RepID=UPI000BA514FB|nr:aspartate/glutamate racemase family protein [Helicobacter sp. 13S00482-2]PAF53011.1 aspartate racemase [Helicobacter sp. 13S00482-2]